MSHQSPILTPQDLQPGSKQDKKKLQQLLQVHDQHCHGNGGSLGHRKFLADEPQAEPTFPLAEYTFYGIALTLVISKLPLRFCDEFWIVLGPAKARSTQPNAMTLTEGTIGTGPVDLISTDNFWVKAVAAAKGPHQVLQDFSFVVGLMTQPIQVGKSIACHRNGDLCPKLNVAPRFATHDRHDMSLIQADDPVMNTHAIRMVENALLANQFTDH